MSPERDLARPRTGWLSADAKRILLARMLRTFGYGYLAVILGVYLAALDIDPFAIGVVVTGALGGSAVMTIIWSLWADRLGRRRTVVIMAILMVIGGLLFAFADTFWLLLLGAFTGTISATSAEVGAFNTVEQAILPQTVSEQDRTRAFSWYNMLGNFTGAFGALFAGIASVFAARGLEGADSYRPLFVLYALIGLVNALLFARMSEGVEAAKIEGKRKFIGIHRSRPIVIKLSLLYGIDAFAGGFVVHTLVAFWFSLRWDMSPEALGVIFFWVGVVSGLSLLAAPPIAKRFGLLNTMVFTHLPSNVLLILVPLAPTPWLAVALFLARMSVSQMDVPTRQSYTMAVVDPDERTATAGLTNVARTTASAVAPAGAGWAFSFAALGAPFFIAGGLKIVYDLLIYREFRHVRPPEEKERLNK